MSTVPGGAALAARAAAATEASATLFSDLREELAATLGIELLDLRSRAADGTWVMICRFAPADTGGASAQVPATGSASIETWAIPEPPDPPFVSPVLSSPPFEGDGSNDLLRFIEEADPSVSVPAVGPRGELPPLLTAEERARMLASTIAGDVVLALMHEGGADDPQRLGAALDAGWERYTTEVRRLGRDPDATLYRMESERAAAMIVEGF